MSKRYAVIISALLLTLLIAIIGSKLIFKVPQQPYTAIRQLGPLEIRSYPKAIMATVNSNDVSYKGSARNNFRRLAGYIFGRNKESTKIAMTAPVHMEWKEDGSAMSFVMPEGYDLGNLPRPISSDIRIRESNSECVAALRFSGYASDGKIQSKQKELKDFLKKEKINYSDNFRFLGYNAPWDFLFRRNEIVVVIDSTNCREGL